MHNMKGQEEAIAPSLGGTKIVPFTFQQHSWRSRFQPDDRLNRLDTVFAVRLSGLLNAMLFKRSLQELVIRHESLRARIMFDDGAPRQHIHPPGEHALEIIQIDGGPVTGAETMRHIAGEFANRRRELSKDRLFDMVLLKNSERDHLLVWGISHFITDGYSLNLMFREIWSTYIAFTRNLSFAMKSPSSQFSDYQLWQHDTYRIWLQKHRVFWKQRLSGAVGIKWPAEGREPQAISGAVARARVSFSYVLSTGLLDLAKRTRTSISLAMIAVYVSVLAQLCNQLDFVIQTNVYGRDRPEHRHIVGYLSHFVYLRIQLNGTETFIDLLNYVTQEYQRTLLHKDFGALVDETPELVAGTYFQWLSWGTAGVAGIPTPAESAEAGIAGELFDFEQSVYAADKLRCATTMWNTNEGIRGTIYWRMGLFSPDDVESYVSALRTAAERCVEQPDSRII